jgi:ABC-2 type transport system permease protein
MRQLRFTWALVSIALAESFAKRAAFALQVVAMMLNNLLFFSMWWVLFARFEQIRGYRVGDMEALFGISTIGFGLAVTLCGGSIDLARIVSDGELDALLTQPKSVLLRALASRSIASGWGDIATGVVLLWRSGYHHVPAILFASVISGVAFAAGFAVLQSSAFWLGRMDSVAKQLIDLLITFSCYPPGAFGTQFKLLLYTVIPAGLVTFLPVELVRDPGLHTAVPALAAVVAYACFAAWVFKRGLRRYESGSRIG